MGGIWTQMLKQKKMVSEYIQTDEEVTKDVLVTPKYKIIQNSLLDPRSATAGIQRTPLVLQIKENEEETPKTKPKPFLETDIDEVISPIEKVPIPLKHQLDDSLVDETDAQQVDASQDLEDQIDVLNHESSHESDDSIEVVEESFTDDVDEEDDDNSEIISRPRSPTPPIEDPVDINIAELVSKDLVLNDSVVDSGLSTPIRSRVGGGRKPLGLVSHNQLIGSPSLAKPWKGIHEERVKLGLAEGENTPPSLRLPTPDKVQSAPGGRKLKFRSKARWDNEYTLVI